MTLVAAAVAGVAVFLGAARRPGAALVDRVGSYLAVQRSTRAATAQDMMVPLSAAGLAWTPEEARLRRMSSAGAGALCGVLMGQGDLLVSVDQSSIVALGIIGALAGMLAFRIWITQRADRRSAQLRAELPVVADLIALRVLAGESVATALEHVVVGTSGVAADEFAQALAQYRAGGGLAESLYELGRRSRDGEAERLFGFLANAHQSGGRLAEALFGLSSDYRAQQERDLQVEGGKRALVVYAPILALMIPVALLFLMFPTVAGLSELSTLPG